MKTTVSKVMAAYVAAADLTQSKTKMPARAAYWVARLLAKLEPEYNAAEGQRVALIQKHGQAIKDKEGNATAAFQVLPENLADFRAEWDPVADETIDIDVQPIALDVFGQTELDPAQLLALGDFVVESAAA